MTQTTTDLRTILTAQIAEIANTDLTDTIGQQCSLDIDSDGTLTLSTQHRDTNSITFAIYNGVTRSFGLPSGVIPGELADSLTDNLDDLVTLVEGMDSHWDGSNRVGTLSAEAGEIEERWDVTGQFKDLGYVGEMEASEWLYPVQSDIKAQPTLAAAIEFAIGGHPEDGLWTDDGMTTYISRDGMERVATEWWTEAQSDTDSE